MQPLNAQSVEKPVTSAIFSKRARWPAVRGVPAQHSFTSSNLNTLSLSGQCQVRYAQAGWWYAWAVAPPLRAGVPHWQTAPPRCRR